MRHYVVVPEGDDVEVTFMYHGLVSVKRVYAAPDRLTAEVEAGEREAFWQDIGRPAGAPAKACCDDVIGFDHCVRAHGHGGSHRSASGAIWK